MAGLELDLPTILERVCIGTLQLLGSFLPHRQEILFGLVRRMSILMVNELEQRVRAATKKAVKGRNRTDQKRCRLCYPSRLFL